jgi:hypothetical protein
MKRPLWLARCAPVDAVIEDRRWAGKRSATNFSSHSVGHEVSSQCRQSASLLMGAVHYVRNVNFSLGSVATLDRCSVLVCSTPYLLTESLRRRETSLCAKSGHLVAILLR